MTTAAPIEAKKHASRQTQDGVVISFVLHPQDVPAELAVASLGTRYALALVEITEANEAALSPAPPAPQPDNPRRKWADMPPSQQAALACQDKAFRAYLRHGRWTLVDDPDDVDTDRALKRALDVASKRELDGEVKAALWHGFYANFLRWSGRTPEAR